ncbi:hypothetical protein N8476_00835 [Akkermansiaceae bacterium]|nr:hypothetical protein [Akkermansiaceae bacterium]
MRYSKPSNTFFTSTIKNLLVMALATLAVGCGEKDSPSGKHQVTAVIQIHPTKPNFYTTNESFIANEIASLSLGVNLAAAALMGNWESQDIDPNNIQKNLVVTRISGTDMASITLHSDDPDQAKNIIEALIESYLVTRKKNEEDRAKKALKALDNEGRELSDLVQDYRKDLTVLIQQYGIPYFDGGSAGNRLGLSEQAMFQSARAKLADLETELALISAKNEALERDEVEQNKIIPQLEVLEKQVLKMREMVAARQEDAIRLSMKQTSYTQAKEQYEQARGRLIEMKKEYSEARIRLRMARYPITVRQEPTVAKSTNKDGGVISSKDFDSKSGEVNAQTSKAPIEAGRRDPMNQPIVNGSRSKIKKEFQGFMKLPEGSGQTQFIDRSADLSLAFSNYYRENPFPRASGKLTMIGVNVLKLPDGELGVESIWSDVEGYKWGALHILDRTNSSWRLDWENFAPYSTESWPRFINQLEGSSKEGTFRLLVRKRRTADDSNKISLSFYRPPNVKEVNDEFKNSESPEIDLLAGSELAKEFMRLWEDHKEGNGPMGSFLGRALNPDSLDVMRITVRLGWEDKKRDKGVLELKEIIGAGWFGERIIKLRKGTKDDL